EYLQKEEDLGLNDDDFEIICKQKVNGRTFFKITKEELRSAGLGLEPATALVNFAKECKDKKLRSFSSYLSLSEVLAEYGYDSDGIDSILLFSISASVLYFLISSANETVSFPATVVEVEAGV
ncbi:hypothetical protein RhiirC2_722770, partial [Rhizophagus irregularis]